MNYEILMYHVVIGDNVYNKGDIVKHFDGYPWDQAIRNKALKIAEGSKESKKKDDNIKLAEVVKSGIWYKVVDIDGNTIGKATRDEEEAIKIKDDYENA